MNNEKDVHALLGELSTKFSTLDYIISSIIVTLVDVDNPAIGAILIDKNTLYQNLETLTKLTHFKLADNSDLAAKIQDLKIEVNKTRELRNLFIHGLWVIDDSRLHNGMVSCWDMKLKSEQKGKKLTKGEENTFTIAQLEEHVVKVGQLVVKNTCIARELGAIGINLEQ